MRQPSNQPEFDPTFSTEPTNRGGQSALIARQTCQWLEAAVIGLNLCPFAAPVHLAGKLIIVVTPASDEVSLLSAFEAELLQLHAADPLIVESTLLVHPDALTRFEAYNDFLGRAEERIQTLDLEGDIQIASFHPDYRFADGPQDDPGHCTNRSPYPMLHLLRESSISAVIDSGADTDAVVRRNQRVMQQLGLTGWRELSKKWTR